VILMMTTTLLTPPILVSLFRNDAPGTRRQLERTEEKTAEFSFPSPEIADLLTSKLLSIFDSEGFFIHLVDRTRRVYQLRKEDMIIGLRSEGTGVAFSCRGNEMDLINTAMYEVVADLERTIAGLRQPIDAKALAQRMLGEMETPGAKEGLAKYLDIGALLPKLKGATKEAVIDDLLTTLERLGLMDNFDEARESVWEREKSMSTGMQHGIAIPHGRTDAVKQLVCAVGLHREGVDFECLDGEPARIIVLALSPKSGTAPHMQFMSMMGHALSGRGREALLSCRTARDMYAVLTGGRRT